MSLKEKRTLNQNAQKKDFNYATYDNVKLFGGVDLNSIKNMAAAVKDIHTDNEATKFEGPALYHRDRKVESTHVQMQDTFLSMLAQGEDLPDWQRKATPSQNNLLRQHVLDMVGKQRPKFINPKTGKAVNFNAEKAVKQSAEAKPATAAQQKKQKNDESECMVLDLGAPKVQKKKTHYYFEKADEDERFANKEDVLREYNEQKAEIEELLEDLDEDWHELRVLRD